MSQYPIHVFVAPDGTWYPASETDQAHVSLERAKRVRTRTIRRPGCVERTDGDLIDIDGPAHTTILVSAGLWSPSQLGYGPFHDAVVAAAAEAYRITQRGGFTYCDHQPWMSRPECAAVQKNTRVRSPTMRRALWLHAVKGYSIAAAVRIALSDRPEPRPSEGNQIRQLQRLIKSARRALEILRATAAHAGA